jgi:hypothetical protein
VAGKEGMVWYGGAVALGLFCLTCDFLEVGVDAAVLGKSGPVSPGKSAVAQFFFRNNNPSRSPSSVTTLANTANTRRILH